METNSSTSISNNKLFTDLFRPKELDQALIVPRIREELSKGLKDHLLFCGTQGAGKTTLTRIMCKDLSPSNVLEINASMERGIDVIREQVQQFCSTISLFDGAEQLKVVVLEECDNMTNDAWASLRALIEKYQDRVRFIANCNFIDKIPAPIQSRFNVIVIDPINKDEENYLFNCYVERVKSILDYIKISYTPENVEMFVKNSFPDMRTIIKKIQQLVIRQCKELTPDMLSSTFDCAQLFELITSKPDPWNNYKALVSEWSNKSDEGIMQIGRQFPEYLNTKYPNKVSKLPVILITISEYSSMVNTSIDKFVTFLGLVYKLQFIFNQ